MCTPTRDICVAEQPFTRPDNFDEKLTILHFRHSTPSILFLLINSLFVKYSFSFSPPLQCFYPFVEKRTRSLCSSRAIKISFMAKWRSRFLLLNILRERASIPRIPLNDTRKIERNIRLICFNRVRKVFEKKQLGEQLCTHD